MTKPHFTRLFLKAAWSLSCLISSVVFADTLITYHTAEVQFYRGISGAPGGPVPVVNPTYGHHVLDPGLAAAWVLRDETVIPFTFQADTNVGNLVFTLRDRPHVGSIGSVSFPLSQAGGSVPLELDVSQLFSGTPDPGQVYYLGISLSGTPSSFHKVQAFFNDTQVGMDYSQTTLRPPSFEFAFYYDDGSLKPPRAQITEPALLLPHTFSTDPALGSLGSRAFAGAIEHYRYQLEDGNDHPDIFTRKWFVYRVQGSGWTPVAGAGTSDPPDFGNFRFKAPQAPTDDSIHYRIYCQTFDGRGVASDHFELNLLESNVFPVKVGADLTRDPQVCTLIGWESFVNGVDLGDVCGQNRHPEGKLFAMPSHPDIDPAEDGYRVRYSFSDGSHSNQLDDKHPDPVFSGGFHDPAYWHDKGIQETDFPVTVQWSLRSSYGWTDWSPATVVEFQPPDIPAPPFETELSFDWQEPRPSELIPEMIVKIQMDLNGDETHLPYYSLWIYNDSNPSLNRRLAYTGGNNGRCEQADPTSSGRYSGWRITQQVLDHLNLGSQDQAVLRVKVKWVPSADDAPCQAPVAVFLDDFDQGATFDEDYPEIFADSAGIGGEPGETFAFDTFSVQIQGGNPATVFATTGSVNFLFAETHSGSLAPSRLLWRWRDGNQYWSDGVWGSDDGFKDPNGSTADPLVTRWQWDETSGMVTPAPTGAEPFGGLTTAFFNGTNSRTVTVETMMIFDNGGQETELPGPPLSLALSLNLPDFVIADFSLDSGSGETTEWHTAQGGLPDFTLTIDTTSPVTQDVYLSLQRGTTPLECGTLSSLAGNLFTLTESVTEQGNVRFILTADGTSGLATHLNGGTGVFTLKVGVDPCAGGQVPPPNRTVTITVNPSEGFLIRVHFRDHLGSSVISKAFSPVFEGSEAGQPMVLDLGGSPIHLYPRPMERHHYDPFGQRIGNAGNEDNPRYTDHEFDNTTGFNYMKGRFQLPDRAKFNRPDPMRDWDWLNPHSLNLYQYIRNDPINNWDPFGLTISDDLLDSAARDSAKGGFLNSIKAGLKFSGAVIWETVGAPAINEITEKAITGKGHEIRVLNVLSALTELPGLKQVKQIGIGVKGTVKGGKVVLNSIVETVDETAGALIKPRNNIIENAANRPKPKRNPNKLEPNPDADAPHSSFRTDENGKVTNYETYEKNPATGELVPIKRFRGKGKTHGGVNPPLVLEPRTGKGPGSPPVVPRKPRPEELPKGYKK